MARPNKNGLDYFPLDVDVFSDNKLKFIRARFDEKGKLIAIKILCEIYRNGYYTEWNEDISLIFSDSAGRNITANLANDVVHELVKRGFFDKGIFDRFKLLTSKGIQRRYITAVKDRKDVEIISDYWLIELPESTKNTTFIVKRAENAVSSAGNEVNSSGNDTNKTKPNETTPPKSPAGETGNAAEPLEAEEAKVPYKRIMELYNAICTKLPKIQKIDGKRRAAVSARYKSYNNDLSIFKTLFEKAEASKFMTGGGEKNWVADFDFLMTADGMTKTLEGKYDNKPSAAAVKKSDGIDHALLAKTQELERKYAEEANKNINTDSEEADW